MALNAAAHHSAEKVAAGEKNSGLRAQTSFSAARPGVLKDPAPQGAVTVGYVAAPGPLLCTPLLADTTADGVDAGALAFLTRAALETQEEEERRVQLAQAKAERREQRVRRQEMVDELAELWRASLPSQRTPSVERRISELRSSLEASSSSMPSLRRRKRKKRRKKRLLRRHGCRRPCVHQRQVPAVRFSLFQALGTPVVTQRQLPTVHSFILPVLLLDKVLDMPVVVPRQVSGLMVQKTADSPQLQSFAGRQHPLRAANAVPHGPGYSPDHRDSTVAAYWSMFLLPGCADSQVLLWRSPWRSHSCSSSRNLRLSTSPLYLAVKLVCLVLPLEYRTTDFLGDDFRNVSLLGTPRFDSGHIGVSLRGFLEEFHTPLYLAFTCMVFGVHLWSTRAWIFWEMIPGMISVLNTPRFDSGYLFGVSLRSLLEVFSSFFNAILGSTVDTSLRQTTEAGFTGYVAPRAVFLRCPQVPDACHHGRFGPERMSCVAVQITADPQLQFRAGRRHLFRCAEAVPHGPGYSSYYRVSPVVRIWWSMSLFVRSCRFSVVVWFTTVEIPQCSSSSSPSWYRGSSHGPDCSSDH